MTGLKGNCEVCFPLTLNVFPQLLSGNIEGLKETNLTVSLGSWQYEKIQVLQQHSSTFVNLFGSVLELLFYCYGLTLCLLGWDFQFNCLLVVKKSLFCIRQSGSYFQSFSCDYEYFYPPGWRLVHHRLSPSTKFTSIHLLVYTWVERGTLIVNCLAQ